MSAIALVDANHFHVAGERVFDLRLERRPVVVSTFGNMEPIRLRRNGATGIAAE